tara:strand:- start:8225 stop:8764 length:540 start_codon:yes stop_codon:yes gene_type:complete
MKSAYITVVGNLPVRFDLEQTRKIGPVISSANSNKSIKFDYATANTETNLQDMLNSPNFRGTDILVPEKLFKKYVFFDGVTCLPSFPGLKSYDIDPEKCAPQILSLMLAVYLRQTIVFLLGYDISNPVELTRLKSIMIANPNTKFMYICDPPRTYQLDDLNNGFCDNYIKFQELIDRAG